MAKTKTKVDNSSNVVAYAFDGYALIVDFKDGASYRYDDVPADVVKGLEEADSKGKYLSQHIKDKFTATKLEKPDDETPVENADNGAGDSNGGDPAPGEPAVGDGPADAAGDGAADAGEATGQAEPEGTAEPEAVAGTGLVNAEGATAGDQPDGTDQANDAAETEQAIDQPAAGAADAADVAVDAAQPADDEARNPDQTDEEIKSENIADLANQLFGHQVSVRFERSQDKSGAKFYGYTATLHDPEREQSKTVTGRIEENATQKECHETFGYILGALGLPLAQTA